MTRPIAFIDTETTSLRPDRRAWEIGLIARSTKGIDIEYSWFIDGPDLDLGSADPASLRIGGFYQRHPQMSGDGTTTRRPAGDDSLHDEFYVLYEVERLTRDAVIHGSNPGFDMDVLGARMRANGICPSWHYRPEDVPTLAKGWLLGRGVTNLLPDAKSDAISLACGINPDDFERHTALGDCRWMRALYDLVTTSKGEQ